MNRKREEKDNPSDRLTAGKRRRGGENNTRGDGERDRARQQWEAVEGIEQKIREVH